LTAHNAAYVAPRAAIGKIVLFCHHWKRVAQAPISFGIKLRLWFVLIENEIRSIFLKILIKTAGVFCPKKWKENLACAIYWRWVHNPNMKVEYQELFLQRAINPILGWWR